MDYLLGKDRQREQARVLRGNPEHVRELIDGCDFARAYTSGVLSFQEPDIADAEKSRLMDEWEHTLLTGLDCDQYACLWVEHRDKGRLELNFVIPNIELQSGKRLQPYLTALTAPCQRLADPDQRPAGAARPERSDLPPPADAGQQSSRDKQQAAEKITAGLMNLMQQGVIRSRQDVVTQLESYGLTVARETKSSISIANPDGGRNIRLKGMIYERDFKFGEGLEKSKQQAQDTEQSVKREFARLETSISAELQSSSQSISNAIREQNGRLTGMLRASVSTAMAWIFICFALLIGILSGIIWFRARSSPRA